MCFASCSRSHGWSDMFTFTVCHLVLDDNTKVFCSDLKLHVAKVYL